MPPPWLPASSAPPSSASRAVTRSDARPSSSAAPSRTRWTPLLVPRYTSGTSASIWARMGQFHFDPSTYRELMAREVPAYDRLQDEVAAASRCAAARDVLDLGTGTGETARRILASHPGARLVGVDASPDML